MGNMPEKGRKRKEGTEGGKEGRKKGEKERDIMNINDIVHS